MQERKRAKDVGTLSFARFSLNGFKSQGWARLKQESGTPSLFHRGPSTWPASAAFPGTEAESWVQLWLTLQYGMVCFKQWLDPICHNIYSKTLSDLFIKQLYVLIDVR